MPQRKHAIPSFNIKDKHTIPSLMIKWSDENNKIVSRSIRYGGRKTKEQAYKEIEDIKYEVLLMWLEKHRNLKTVGTQYDTEDL